jgi:hypothetical protein
VTSPVGKRVGWIVGLHELRSPCPECAGEISVEDVIFAGVPVLCEGACSRCRRRFWLHWPTGHALLHPVLIDMSEHRVFYDGLPWYAELVESVVATREDPARPPIVVHERASGSRAAVVVDCLDPVYGHVVLKLLGALPLLRQAAAAVDVVPIVPSTLAWLVPEAAGPTIEVDLPLALSRRWIAGLDEAVKGALASYDTVSIAPSLSQPPLSALDVSLLRRELASVVVWPRAVTPERLTFVLRDDRRWVGDETLLLRALRKLAPRRAVVSYEQRRQDRQVRMLAEAVRRRIPAVEITVLGVARPGGMPPWIADLRTPRPDVDVELRWCEALGCSHVAVGVHGSHMVLPSLLAGAVVDLVPWYKLPQLTQDLIVLQDMASEPKLTLLRYRVLPANVGRRPLADVVVSALRDPEYQYRTIVANRDSVGVTHWPRPTGTWRALG